MRIPTPKRHQRPPLANAAVGLALYAGLVSGAAATTVYAENYAYISKGEHGEVSFSDVPSDKATAVELAERGANAPSSDGQVEEMLRVADDLAAARRLRELERAEQREQARRYADQTTRARTVQAPYERDDWWYPSQSYYPPVLPVRPPIHRPPVFGPPAFRPPHQRQPFNQSEHGHRSHDPTSRPGNRQPERSARFSPDL